MLFNKRATCIDTKSRREIEREGEMEAGTVSVLSSGVLFIRKGERMKEICRFIMPGSQRTRWEKKGKRVTRGCHLAS